METLIRVDDYSPGTNAQRSLVGTHPSSNSKSPFEALVALLEDAKVSVADSADSQSDPRRVLYQYLANMSTITVLYTALYTSRFRHQRGRKEPYNLEIAEESTIAYSDQAKAIYQAITGPLKNFYVVSNAISNNIDRVLHFSEINTSLLKNHLPDNIHTETKKTLEELTNEVLASMRESRSLSLVRLINVTYVKSDHEPHSNAEAKTEMFFINIESQLLNDESCRFLLNIVLLQTDLNVEKYLQGSAEAEKLIQTFSKGGLGEDYHKLENALKALPYPFEAL